MRLAVPLGIAAVMAASVRAEASPSARLVYSRSAEAASCPDEAALHQAVASRFGYDPFFAWAPQTVVVQIWRVPVGYRARLQLVDEQGIAHGTRELQSEDDDCRDVFAALALGISISLDAARAFSRAGASVDDRLVSPVQEAASTEPSPSHPKPTDRASPAPAPVRAPIIAPRWVRVGADVVGSAGLSRTPASGVALFGEVRRASVSFGFEIQAQASFPSSALAGSVDSALFTATFAPCLHVAAAYACALGEVGWQEAWGAGVDHPRSDGTAFVGAGARLGVEWPFASQLFMHLHADALVDIDRAEYQLANRTVWTAPALAGVFAVGVGTFL